MFSFHKPRVYRSAEGCCICRAKSSSSRFTDSRKYEVDSVRCFNLETPRLGEICNACVLLVKRYKRLPPGSVRHWGHVVDARAGPGTKSITKYKKYKDDNDETIKSVSTINSNLKRSQNTKTIIAEKFSKIFKKSKKNSPITTAKAPLTVKKDINTTKSCTHGKRKAALLAQSTWEQHSLPTTPDSLDSDYEDSRTTYSSSVVQFQTQTRASSYRSRTNNSRESNTNPSDIRCADAGGSVVRKHSITIAKWKGSKRRKCFKPYKNRRAIDTAPFFDCTEWEERKSCCGTIYECKSFSGALLLDLDHYKPCEEHQWPTSEKPSSEVYIHQTIGMHKPEKPTAIIATMPAVVTLAPPSLPPPQSTKVNVVKSTPVLKKHHLFFKRQSECFPHVDLNVANNSSSTNNQNNSNSNKTEVMLTATNIPVTNATRNSISTAQQQKSNNLPFSINSTSISSSVGAGSTSYIPRHTTAKITLSPPIIKGCSVAAGGGGGGLTAAPPPASSLNKKHNLYMQNLKGASSSDVYALQRNIPCYMKSGEVIADGIQDGKNLVNDFEKTLLMGKPISALSTQHQSIPASAGCSPTSSSSSSSSSSTKFSDNSSDSGFDENMQERKSASPLQEDTERKIQTRSGVQTLFLPNGLQVQGHQNVVLAGNEYAVKILQGQRRQQMAQQPQQQNNHLGITTPAIPTCTVTGAGAAGGGGGTLSVVHASRAVVGSGGGSAAGSHAKMRAIYNSNAIQHENGVTTIVPASSLAATTQTAAMNALAPSTVTITPAPLNHHHQQPQQQQQQQQQHHQQQQQHHHHHHQQHQQMTNTIATGKKLSPATITNQQSNIIGSVGVGGASGAIVVGAATHLNNTINNHSFLNNTNINSGSNLSSLNQTQQQKIILIKNAAKHNNNNNNIGSVINILPANGPSTTTTTTTATLHNHKQSVCKK